MSSSPIGEAAVIDEAPAPLERDDVPPVAVEIGPLPEPTKPSWPRLLALALVLCAIFAVGHFTGLNDYLTRENLRALMEHLGLWGVVLFIVLFVVGELVHVPGIVFVLAALLAYGRLGGAIAAYVGALASISVSFVLVRRVGGQALAHVKRARIAKILAKLDERPIATVTFLRLSFFLLPALNYALAMTRVRFRDYFVGSAIGIFIRIGALALAFDWVMSFFD